MKGIEVLRKRLIDVSRRFYRKGWSTATSGNYSVRVDAQKILITASGKNKRELETVDTVLLDLDGSVQEDTNETPSAEAHLHCALYRWNPSAGSVLHTHSILSTVLSSIPSLKVPIQIGGYEMLKAFRGVSTHLHTENIPVFPNHQDMKVLTESVINYLQMNPNTKGFLIAGHGLYSWGTDIDEAERHVEALEFLLECEYRKLSLKD